MAAGLEAELAAAREAAAGAGAEGEDGDVPPDEGEE